MPRTRWAFLVTLFISPLVWGEQPVTASDVAWLYPDFPPYTITSGQNAGQGSADVVMKLLINEIPGYRYETMVASPLRVMHEMRNGRQVCTPDLLKTPEREKFVVFSSLPSLPPGLLTLTIRKGELPQIDSSTSISLAQVLKHRQFTVGAASGRSFGVEIDRLLQQHPSNLTYRAGNDINRGLLEMLVRHRIDGVLGYAREAGYLRHQMGLQDKLITLPIREKSRQMMGYVGCSKTAWGRGYIQKVDAVLRKIRTSPQYRADMERWINPYSKPTFRKLYNQEFLSVGSAD